MTLVSCLVIAPGAIAGGGVGGLCPNGPCMELVAVAVNGNPITPTSNVTVQPGDAIETNLFISGWGPAIDRLGSYEFTVAWPVAAQSGTRGTILPFGWTDPLSTIFCSGSSDCPLGMFCTGGICKGLNHDPNLATLIDVGRADFVFAQTPNTVTLVPTGSPFTYRISAGVFEASNSAQDDGTPRYGGTFRLVVSDFACGTFVFADFPTPTLSDPMSPSQSVLASTPTLTINVGPCDCNGNGADDLDEVAGGTVLDCNANNVPDACEPDCQPNGIADACDITNATSVDCDFNVVPDECEAFTDCNQNGIRDACEVVGPNPLDCNENGVPDDCDPGFDCNGNGTLDSCDLDSNFSIDCQSNGIPDECDIASGLSVDNDHNGVPDECETFCAQSACGPGPCLLLKAVSINGVPIEPTSHVTAARGDVIETEIWLSCWGADLGRLRAYQAVIQGRLAVASGDAGLVLPVGWDAPLDNVLCDPNNTCPINLTCVGYQCVGPNHFPDLGSSIDVSRDDYVFSGLGPIFFRLTTTLNYFFAGLSQNTSGTADAGQPKYGGTLLLRVSDNACGEFTFDFVTKGPGNRSLFSNSATDIAPNSQPLFIQTKDCDCNDNGVLDDEEIASGAASDCNGNSLPDDCDADCDGNGIPNDCEIAACNGDRACGDCNENGIPDGCDIASGNSTDLDGNGTPDDCFRPIPTVSQWGLAVLAILLLTVAKLRFARTSRTAAPCHSEPAVR